jgi:hypothetical protein
MRIRHPLQAGTLHSGGVQVERQHRDETSYPPSGDREDFDLPARGQA